MRDKQQRQGRDCTGEGGGFHFKLEEILPNYDAIAQVLVLTLVDPTRITTAKQEVAAGKHKARTTHRFINTLCLG